MPQDEILLYGILRELGFQSFIARSMLRKEIKLNLKESADEDSRGPAVLNNVKLTEAKAAALRVTGFKLQLGVCTW